ncbi:MAG: GGDEF domain-containing protein [Desulfurivibrio sp.]|nr:GGDEF domain-containing protein [Desulfurivibrio sp.]
MNAAVALRPQRWSTPAAPVEPGTVNSVNSLLLQLDHYRRQTSWLALVNKLQARLAGATDLAGMLEAYSVWLMPQLEHDLVAFRNTGQNHQHLLCSCHGPERRDIIDAAHTMLEQGMPDRAAPCSWEGDFFGCRWGLQLGEDSGLLLILRRQREFTADEIELLARTVEIMSEPLQRALAYEDLFEQARRDFLTGLDNRRVFDERIGPLLENARRYQHPLTLLSMDLDRFKELNDTHGHAEGDRALRRVATTLSAMVRTSDLLVRMGGDEFLLVLPDSDSRAAKILAHRICRAVNALHFGEGGSSERLGISIGIVPWTADLALNDWLGRADEALYRAKSVGCCWVCLNSEDNQESVGK